MNTVPQPFLQLAEKAGIKPFHATEYYLRRISGRQFFDISMHIQEDFGSVTEASRALINVWKNWKSANHTNTIQEGGQTVTLNTPASVANTKRAVLTGTSFLDQARDGLEKVIGPIKEFDGAKARTTNGVFDVAGDFHIPFHDPKSLAYLLKSDATELFMMGDFTDMLAASAHRQTNDYVTLQEELAVARAVLEELSQKYTKIYMISGNHDARPVKRMQSMLPGLMPLLLHPLAWLSIGIKNVEFKNLTVPNTAPILNFGKDYSLDFAGLHSNALFGHFEGFCGDDAVRKLDVWLMEWSHILKIQAPRMVLQGHCFDEKTEILTPEGWMNHTELTLDTKVMTLNKETNALEWNKINEIHRYDDFKELITVKGMGVNLKVTGQHGLWLGTRTTSKNGKTAVWADSTAEESFGKRKIFQLAGQSTGSGVELTTAQTNVLAWILAEGNVYRRFSETTPHEIKISQSDVPDGRLAQLEKDLTDAGIQFWKYKRYDAGTVKPGGGTKTNYDAYIYSLKTPGTIWKEWISKYIDFDKVINYELLNMPKEQADAFIHTWVTADGSVNSSAKNSRQIAAKRDHHIDFLQALCAINNYRTSVAWGDSISYLTLNTRNTSTMASANWAREAYDGQVWCVSVDNGTLLVRREGNTAITLNTHRLGMDFTPTGKLLVSTGCMAKPQEYQLLQHGKYKPPVQGFVKLYKNNNGEFDLNRTQLIHTGE